ncbi:MAG TPA: zf-HC2 domain-containing protein [Pyrinomonadaceae bacterium]|jgi:anti-sigma factor RsiW|nr:zf-HC2 domain-containing protein [Pyrinomonadaceae bacterium]
MNCHFTEKISLLVDGELGEQEAKELGAHLSTCEACQRSQADFLQLRSELKAYSAAPDFVAQRRTLRRILVSENPPPWKRSVRLPVPTFALLLAAVVALGIWLVYARQSRQAPAKAETKPVKIVTMPAASQDALDLARFDRGERAAIYKVRRTSQGDVEQ